MSTLDVEELVTRPVERAVLGTPQVASVRSASQPGLSVVTLLFEDDVDVYRARQLVTERLQIAALPAGAHVPRLAPIAAPIGALLKSSWKKTTGIVFFSLSKLNDSSSTFVSASMLTDSAGCGSPMRISGPQYAFDVAGNGPGSR